MNAGLNWLAREVMSVCWDEIGIGRGMCTENALERVSDNGSIAASLNRCLAEDKRRLFHRSVDGLKRANIVYHTFYEYCMCM